MVFKEIKKELLVSNHPVIKSLYQGVGFIVLIIGFNKGMILKEHIAHIRAKLTVLKGAVTYKEKDRTIKLQKYDEVEIPIEVKHTAEALEDSYCILIQGD